MPPRRACSRVTSASRALGVISDYALYKSSHSLTHSLSNDDDDDDAGATYDDIEAAAQALRGDVGRDWLMISQHDDHVMTITTLPPPTTHHHVHRRHAP